MKNRTLIIGDLHIGKGVSIGKPAVDGGFNSRVLDQLQILNWILALGIKNEVNRFIITGDVFEEVKPDYNLVVMFMEWLRECSDYNIEVHIIIGNHDIRRSGNRYNSVLDILSKTNLDNVVVYNDFYTLNTEGVSFTFVPFRDRKSLGKDTVEEAVNAVKALLKWELDGINDINDKVVIGHMALEKSFWVDEIGSVLNEVMLPINTFEGYDYVWLGHVHRPQKFNASNPYVSHIGSMDISDFGEVNHKKIVILYDPEMEGKFEEIIIPTRNLRILKVDVCKDQNATNVVINEICKIKPELFNDAIVKLEIKLLDQDIKEVDRDVIMDKLKELNVYHVCSFSESKNVSVLQNSKSNISDSAINEREAIKLYSELLEFDNDAEKDEFINACLDVIKI
jgi:exonuclease SbcD